MSPRVVVIDYGVGNLHSVTKALSHEGADVAVSADPDEIRKAPRVVLPGVGAFPDGMRELRARGLVEPIREVFQSGRPFIGICLGMQLLLAASEEFGTHEGLGWIPGRVLRVPDGQVKVPHVGWNRIAPPPSAVWKDSVLDALGAERPMMYFVHSYNAVPEHEEHRLADAVYGPHRICAAVRRDNVVGCQFHPEKSGPMGLRIVRRFLNG